MLSKMLKKIGKQILSGKNIMNISLPVEGFGNDTFLERLAGLNTFAPNLLEKASSSSSLDRFLYTFCYGFTTSLSFLKMVKPFNPILGETYQGIIDGCPVYMEQISHHPPISSLLMIGRGYKICGKFVPTISMGLNKATVTD